jgi:hypothetical protein
MQGKTKKNSKTKKKRGRIRRTYAQLFLDKLKKLSGKEQKLVSNMSLRQALGWDEERYFRIRTQLRDQRQVIVGTGHGGRVGLADAPGAGGSNALSVFISYSHADEAFKNDLTKHLEPLRRLKLIEAWHDRKIKPGEEWDKSISANLEKAEIILLLISIDFINSPYCYDTELDRAIERQAAKEAEVIPIILRNCMWQQTPFGKLQALPKDARPVSLWPDRDDALVNVADGVRQVAEKLLASR